MQHLKVACLAEQVVARAAKAMEKAKHVIEREQNQRQRALRAKERAEGQQTLVSRGEVEIGVAYNGGFKNPSISSHEKSRVAPVDVLQVCHSTIPSMPIPIDMHNLLSLSNHLPHSQLGTPLLSTLHSTSLDDLPPSSRPFSFPYYVSPMSMQPNQP